MSRYFLEVSRLLVLAEAVPAVDRSVCRRLERYFAFFAAVGAYRLVHFAWAAEAATALSVSICHICFSCCRTFVRTFTYFRHLRKSPYENPP